MQRKVNYNITKGPSFSITSITSRILFFGLRLMNEEAALTSVAKYVPVYEEPQAAYGGSGTLACQPAYAHGST